MANRRIDSAASAGAGDGDPWSDAFDTVTLALAAPAADGDRLWVAPAHSVTPGAAITWTLPGVDCQILGVDSNTTDPATGLASPITAAESVGAVSSAFTVTGKGRVEGMILSAGSANSSNCVFNLGTGSSPVALFIDRSKIRVPTTNAGGRVIIGPVAGSSNDDSVVDVRNTEFEFGATGQSFTLSHGRIRLSTITLSGSDPVTLFRQGNGVTTDCELVDSDLNTAAWSNLIDCSAAASGRLLVKNCKMPSGWTLTTGTHPGPGGIDVDIDNCDSGDTQIGFARARNAGTIVHSAAVYRDASGGPAYSIRMAPNANAKFPHHPLVWRGAIKVVAGSKTLTIYLVTDRATALDNDEVAVRVHYQGTSGFPLALVASSEAASVFATPANLTSSSESWAGTGGFTNVQKREIDAAFTAAEDGYAEFEVLCFAELTNPLYVGAVVSGDLA